MQVEQANKDGSIRIEQMALEGDKLVTTKVTMIHPGRCPHYIFAAEHYRPDGSCKCNDPNETIMKKWGYRWNAKNKSW